MGKSWKIQLEDFGSPGLTHEFLTVTSHYLEDKPGSPNWFVCRVTPWDNQRKSDLTRVVNHLPIQMILQTVALNHPVCRQKSHYININPRDLMDKCNL